MGERFSGKKPRMSAGSESRLHPRQADQLRTDIANVESGLEVMMEQLARLPTCAEVRWLVLRAMLDALAAIVAIALLLIR